MTEPVATVASSPTVDPPPGLPLVAILAPVALALAGVGLAGAAEDGLVVGDVVRAGLIAAWALAGLFLVRRSGAAGSAGLIVLGMATLAGICSATADRSAALDVAHRLALGLLPAVGLHLLLALPDGRLVTSGRLTTARVGYAVGLAIGIALAVADAPPPWWPVVLEAAAVAAIGVPASNLRYRQVHGLSRQRLQWLGLAVAVALEASLVLLALNLFVDWPPQAGALAAATTVLIPGGLAAGASRRLVTRVDRLLVHVVSAAGLTAVVVAVYLVIVLGLGRVPDDSERSLFVLSMVAAAVAAAVYLPARNRLADAANRLVYGERAAPDEAVRSFGSRLSRAVPMDELLLQLAESLKKTMALRAAEVWTGGTERLDRVVSVPDRPAVAFSPGAKERPVLARAGVVGNAWLAVWAPTLLEGRGDVQLRVAPACHSGEILGLIVAERAADGDLFTEEDDRVLTELARQVGLALHNVALDSALQASLDEVRRQAEELRASRARLVATADAERRKIERNLHDGAQQHLVAMAVNLRLAKDIVSEDPASAVELLDALADSVKDTIQELRDLAHGIYPPLLMDSGLPEALRAAAGRSPLDVGVEADGIGRYPTEVEAAIYFCCLEALQNAAKHAPESHVSVRVVEADGDLRFEVADDGPGFDVAAGKTGGHGFVNMSDRLGAIGGSVDWDSAPGQGTRIAGSVPV